jgi:3-isopropylmalate/(R)-2-methylmalate dehydratase large subunit
MELVLLYIDRHLVHEVTSPQAFEGLTNIWPSRCERLIKQLLFQIIMFQLLFDREGGIDNEESRIQVEALDKNAREFGVHYYPVSDIRQGIVHIVGPEQGWTLPGMTGRLW